jgi:predicted nucleic acid-binding protein
VALVASENPKGGRIQDWLASNREPLATTNLVVVETISRLIKYTRGSLNCAARRELAHRFWTRLLEDGVQVIFIDADVHAAGWGEVQRCTDKDIDLIDACSFTFIKRSGIQWVLAVDEHFDQMQLAFGYSCIMLSG